MEMENGESKTTVDVIVISDDEDSEDKNPVDLYRAEGNNFKNPVIVIEEDDNVNVNVKEDLTLPVKVADTNKPEEKSQASSSVRVVYSPLGKYKVSKDGLKELKAMVKLRKLNLKHRTKPLSIKTEDNGACNDTGIDKRSSVCCASEARDLKSQVSNLIRLRAFVRRH